MDHHLAHFAREIQPQVVTTTYCWPACLDCTRMEIASREELTAALRGLDPEEVLRKHAQRIVDTFHLQAHSGHRIVELTGWTMTGTRSAPEMAERLGEIAPMAIEPAPRFEDRMPLRPAVEQELVRLGLSDLLFEERTGNKYNRRAREYQVESIASWEFSQAEHPLPLQWTRKGVHTKVVIESGLQVLNALMRRAGVQLYRLEQEIGAGSDNSRNALEEHAWWLFEQYLALIAMNDLLTRIHQLWGVGQVPPLASVITPSAPTQTGLTRLFGDVAFMQFRVAKSSALLPGVATLPQVFTTLEQYGYDRLHETRDANVTQRAEKLIKVIAAANERIRIARIDYSPLLKMKFSRS